MNVFSQHSCIPFDLDYKQWSCNHVKVDQCEYKKRQVFDPFKGMIRM